MARWQKREADGNITFNTGAGTFTFGPSMTDEKLGRVATEILSYLGCSFDIKWPDHEPTDEERSAARAKLIEDAEVYAVQHATDEDTTVDFDRLAAAYRAGWRASPKPVNTTIR